MRKNIRVSRVALATAACVTFAMLPTSGSRADNPNDDNSNSQIQRGFEIAPVLLNLAGKNRALVGLGSYLVNSGGCNDCHTHPSYLSGHNPFLGQSELINTPQYLAGGRTFPPSPFVSANITADATGKPAGLTLEQFRTTLRTGHNPSTHRACCCRLCRGQYSAKRPIGTWMPSTNI